MVFPCLLSASKAEQFKLPELCMLKAPLTCFKLGSSTLEGKFVKFCTINKGRHTYSVKLPLKSSAPPIFANLGNPLICFNMVLLAIW